MKKRLIATAVACAGIFGFSTSIFAQGLLDQQLGDKPAQIVKEEVQVKTSDVPAPGAKVSDPGKADTAKPADQLPGGTDVIHPDAVKKVDDQELINQLIKPGEDKPNPQQVAQQLKSMLERMQESEHRLSAEKDPGDLTQETQRRIVMDLDVMIELARQQQQKSSGSSQQPQDGQQRQQQDQQSQNGKGEGGTQAATHEVLPHGSVSDAATGDMRNHDPTSWGGLPPRDRDQVSHGANEEYLSTYRDMIDRYYQALAELGKSKNH